MNIISTNTTMQSYPIYPNQTLNIHNHNHISSIIKNVATDTIYRNRGWYNKTKFILKHMNNNIAICFQCYNSIEYKDIEYSRIIFFDNITNKNKSPNTTNTVNTTNTKNIKPKTNNSANNITGYISCLCKSCCKISDTMLNIPKSAPKTYGDIIADYILNERFDLIAIDIEKINQTQMDIIDDKIKYLKFNVNEKNVILNNLVNENDRLSNNLDLEVEKYKILNEQCSKNKELCENIKTQLLQFSVDLFKQNKKQIDSQINKYNELNNSSKYSIPECKICMIREVKVAIQCGHVFCMDCYNELVKNHKNNSITNANANGEESNVEDEDSTAIIHCPTCRTASCTYTQLYF